VWWGRGEGKALQNQKRKGETPHDKINALEVGRKPIMCSRMTLSRMVFCIASEYTTLTISIIITIIIIIIRITIITFIIIVAVRLTREYFELPD
jgi:hypothetical protein